MQSIVVARSRGVDRRGGRRPVVRVPGHVAVHEDTAGQSIKKGIYPAARREKRAGDAKENVWEFDSCHGHHAADGYGKLQFSIRPKNSARLHFVGRKTYSQDNISCRIHDHESGGSRKLRGIVVDDAAEATLEVEKDVCVDGYRAKLDNEYPEIVE